MINYKRCSEVDMDLVFNAFNIGFSDYVIKIQMPKEAFISRFFGPEGNCIHNSFIALDNDKPIGLVLGGIKEYEGIKTMRCGTMAIDPEYRGQGISYRLMELHREEAVKQGCKQLFLEVIVGNDRAINFYKKLGYEKVYDLYYYTLDDISKLKNIQTSDLNIKSINMQELMKVRNCCRDIHINWQNDIDYIEKSENQVTLGAYIGNKLLGAVSANKNTRINFLYIDNSIRGRGIANNLIAEAAKELGLNKMSVGFPNNASLLGYFKHVGFTKDNISQYEMYLTL